MNYRLDNPSVRSMQAKSIMEIKGKPIAGESLDDYFGPRVSYIIPKSNIKKIDNKRYNIDLFSGSGRAAAISSDGYYLTAYHVADQPVTMVSGPFGVKRIDGRIVKQWKEADLALVKFAYKPEKYFQQAARHLGGNDVLYAAANNGAQRGEDKYGNGPFQVMGKVINVKQFDGYTTTYSTMIARGGMSGSPVVNEKGELVGILCIINLYPIVYTFRSSETRMIPWAEIQNVMNHDRMQNN